MNVHIYVNKASSEDFDSWSKEDLSRFDKDKSTAALDELTLRAVREACPYAEVHLEEEDAPGTFRVVVTPDIDDIECRVDDAIDEVWDQRGWLRDHNGDIVEI
jgi:hypothetical protein